MPKGGLNTVNFAYHNIQLLVLCKMKTMGGGGERTK